MLTVIILLWLMSLVIVGIACYHMGKVIGGTEEMIRYLFILEEAEDTILGLVDMIEECREEKDSDVDDEDYY